MPEIFVSYRRSDSSDVTGRIFDGLRLRFGKAHLFKDFESIPFGTDFREVITRAVRRCEVVLAIIGRDWVRVADANGRRRLDDPEDFVRLEIQSALELGIPVIPVLVQGTPMPSANDLPTVLEKLAYLNAARVRTDPDFHNDMNALYAELEQYLPQATPIHPRSPAVDDAPHGPRTISDQSNRSIAIGGSASGNVFQTGNHNVATLKISTTTLPPPDTIDIHSELKALRELLSQLQTPEHRRIERALEDAEEALTGESTDRELFSEALGRALKCAQRADQFASVIGKLQHHVSNAVSWLGENGQGLLSLVGLTL